MFYASNILNELNRSWALILIHCHSRYCAVDHTFDDVCETLRDCSWELFKQLVDLCELFPHLTLVQQYDAYRKIVCQYVSCDFPIVDCVETLIEDFISYIRYF